MPDNSTPNPSDPDKSESESQSIPQKRPGKKTKLRLKRAYIEETEIKPTEDKEWEPESIPFDEPEEEPVPTGPVPLTPEETEALAPQQTSIPLDEDEEEEDDDELDDGDGEEAQTKKTLSPATRLVLILVPAAIIAGIMVFFLYNHDPLGDDLGSIAPEQIPVDLLRGGEIENDNPEESEGQSDIATMEMPKTRLQDFLSAFQKQPLTASLNPRGVFIDSVFFPEGAVLNKQLGVVFNNLLIENNAAVVVVTSPDGKQLTLPARLITR